MAADAKAFRALMRHIRKSTLTVIMMQVQNEAGFLGDSRDRHRRRPSGKAVPAELMNHLVRNKCRLLRVAGGMGTKRPQDLWAEVFGTDEWADAMAYVGRYHGKVEAGKAELNIPMYANAWLGPQPDQKARTGPAASPVVSSRYLARRRCRRF
jgi:hypothetical protein